MTLIIFLLLIPLKSLAFEVSTVIDENKSYIHLYQQNKTLFFSTLLNNKSNLLYNIRIENELSKLVIGDIFLNFGRGIIVGNQKYNFFIKYQTSYKIFSNSAYPFNTHYPITRGICFEIQSPIKTLVFTISDEKFSEKFYFGILFEIQNYSIILTRLQEEIFTSFNFRYNNLLNLGIVADVEIATKIYSNFSLGFGTLLEWYYKKFEFAFEVKIVDENLKSPLASRMFSFYIPQKCFIFLSKLNEKNLKITLINKITESTNNNLHKEFFFSYILKMFKNTFLNSEVIKDSLQNDTFLSVYPFFDFDIISFSIKPIMNIENKNFERIEKNITLVFSNFKLKLNIFYPLIQNNNYTFTSTEIRDLFKENIDIRTQNSEGIKVITSIIFTNSNIETEGLISISQDGINMYGIINLRIQP